MHGGIAEFEFLRWLESRLPDGFEVVKYYAAYSGKTEKPPLSLIITSYYALPRLNSLDVPQEVRKRLGRLLERIPELACREPNDCDIKAGNAFWDERDSGIGL